RLRPEFANAPDAAAMMRAAAAFVPSCRQYLADRQARQMEREATLRSLIDVLRDGLTTVAADGVSFQASLTSSSGRMSTLAELNDIQMLKHQLTQVDAEAVEVRNRDSQLTHAG